MAKEYGHSHSTTLDAKLRNSFRRELASYYQQIHASFTQKLQTTPDTSVQALLKNAFGSTDIELVAAAFTQHVLLRPVIAKVTGQTTFIQENFLATQIEEKLPLLTNSSTSQLLEDYANTLKSQKALFSKENSTLLLEYCQYINQLSPTPLTDLAFDEPENQALLHFLRDTADRLYKKHLQKSPLRLRSRIQSSWLSLDIPFALSHVSPAFEQVVTGKTNLTGYYFSEVTLNYLPSSVSTTVTKTTLPSEATSRWESLKNAKQTKIFELSQNQNTEEAKHLSQHSFEWVQILRGKQTQVNKLSSGLQQEILKKYKLNSRLSRSVWSFWADFYLAELHVSPQGFITILTEEPLWEGAKFAAFRNYCNQHYSDIYGMSISGSTPTLHLLYLWNRQPESSARISLAKTSWQLLKSKPLLNELDFQKVNPQTPTSPWKKSTSENRSLKQYFYEQIPGVSLSHHEILLADSEAQLIRQVKAFHKTYSALLKVAKSTIQPVRPPSDFPWNTTIKQYIKEGKKLTFNAKYIRKIQLKPFTSAYVYASPMFFNIPSEEGTTKGFILSINAQGKWLAFAQQGLYDIKYLPSGKFYPLYRNNSEEINITDSLLKQFIDHYQNVLEQEQSTHTDAGSLNQQIAANNQEMIKFTRSLPVLYKFNQRIHDQLHTVSPGAQQLLAIDECLDKLEKKVQMLRKDAKDRKNALDKLFGRSQELRSYLKDAIEEEKNIRTKIEAITKETVYYYLFAIAQVSGQTDSIPFHNSFWEITRLGRQLFELHLTNDIPENAEVELHWHKKKLQTLSSPLKVNKRKGEIYTKQQLLVSNIPPIAWKYKVGSKSVLEKILHSIETRYSEKPTVPVQDEVSKAIYFAIKSGLLLEELHALTQAE
ncbi:type ISP restriction/modification enzyme [Rapidithrix thailandica]|uniref:Type ISP restriction/modification enzyme n=1 Tax=Rapidithrix thailandica TaxID=413964 RepID=A0AAW9S5K4_9BACT